MIPLVARYTYRSPSGEPLRRKLRFEPKSFGWQSYDPGTGTWTWGASDPTCTLYNLHLLAAADRPTAVFCCEGEKDADALTGLGLLATTSGHAGSWRRHHSEQLLAPGCCTVAVVLPDCDRAGEAHAVVVARANLAVGLPTKITRLPGLREHEDVSDFIAHGGTPEQILGYARITRLVTMADLPAPEPPQATPAALGPSLLTSKPRRHDAGLIALYLEKLKLAPTVRGRIKVICPFHPDADPSLALDLPRLLWYCHACRVGGGPVEFYVKWQAKEGRVVSRRFARHRLKATYL